MFRWNLNKPALTIITNSNKHYLTDAELFRKRLVLAVARGFGGVMALLIFCNSALSLVARRIESQQAALVSLIAERDQFRSIAQDVGRSCGNQMIKQQQMVQNVLKGRKVDVPSGIGGPEEGE